MQKIGSFIKNKRLKMNFTLENMGNELNISPASYQRYEQEKVKLIHPNFFRIAEILEIDLVDFFRDTSKPALVAEPEEAYNKKDMVNKLLDLINYKDSEIQILKSQIKTLTHEKN